MKATIYINDNAMSVKNFFTLTSSNEVYNIDRHGYANEFADCPGIMKKISTYEIEYTPYSGNHKYKLFTDYTYMLKKIEVDVFPGTIFEHALFFNEVFEHIKQNIDIEKTKNQNVFSERMKKDMPIIEYLKNHLKFQLEKEERNEYKFYTVSSPLLEVLIGISTVWEFMVNGD